MNIYNPIHPVNKKVNFDKKKFLERFATIISHLPEDEQGAVLLEHINTPDKVMEIYSGFFNSLTDTEQIGFLAWLTGNTEILSEELLSKLYQHIGADFEKKIKEMQAEFHSDMKLERMLIWTPPFVQHIVREVWDILRKK